VSPHASFLRRVAWAAGLPSPTRRPPAPSSTSLHRAQLPPASPDALRAASVCSKNLSKLERSNRGIWLASIEAVALLLPGVLVAGEVVGVRPHHLVDTQAVHRELLRSRSRTCRRPGSSRGVLRLRATREGASSSGRLVAWSASACCTYQFVC
jgi:hypothetical protein